MTGVTGALFAWAVTLALEIPLAMAVYPGQRLRMGATCAVATSVTNLGMNLVLVPVLGHPGAALLLGEGLALVGEALAYWAVARPRAWGPALTASGLANAASWTAGMLLLRFGVG